MFHRCHMSHDLFHIGVIISLSHDSIAMLPFYINMGIVLFRNFKSLKIPSQRHVSILCCIYDLSWSVTDGLDSISKIASNLINVSYTFCHIHHRINMVCHICQYCCLNPSHCDKVSHCSPSNSEPFVYVGYGHSDTTGVS